MSNIEQELKQLNDFMTDHKVLYASDSTKNRRMWINLRGKFFVTKLSDESQVLYEGENQVNALSAFNFGLVEKKP